MLSGAILVDVQRVAINDMLRLSVRMMMMGQMLMLELLLMMMVMLMVVVQVMVVLVGYVWCGR